MNTHTFENLKIQCPNCRVILITETGLVRLQRPELVLTVTGFWGEVRYQCPQCQHFLDLLPAGEPGAVPGQHPTHADITIATKSEE